MAVHRFTFEPHSTRPGVGPVPERAPAMSQTLPGEPDPVQTDLLVSDINVNKPEIIKDVLVQGFYSMDKGMKQYFSEIQVPTKDSVRALTTRISGGDKTFLQWVQDLRSGRIQLPVLGINRTSWRFNPQKFSPPYINMSRRFADIEGKRIILTYRPWPALIDYSLSFWTERKRDMEYIMHQILIRFNPLAEFTIDDEAGMRGNVQLKMGEAVDNSDIDIGGEELAKVRYDVNVTMEGWLPLPEKVLPATLGKVMSLHEKDGKFLETFQAARTFVTDGFFKSPEGALKG